MALLFDIEANGFLDKVTKVHCLVIKDSVTGQVTRYRGAQVEEGVGHLMVATGALMETDIIAHNGIKYDIPVLKKLYPWFNPEMSRVKDTLVISRLIYTNMADVDSRLSKHKRPTGKLHGSHSLEAWGIRLGCHKDDYQGGWEEWNQEMEDYCEQDVHVLHKLWDKLCSKNFSAQSIEIEHKVAEICFRQEVAGFSFNETYAATLYADLIEAKLRIEEELRNVFRPRYRPAGAPVVTKKGRRVQEELLGVDHYRSGLKSSRGKTFYKCWEFEENTKYQKITLTAFNPGSRQHIHEWLRAIHGWEPTEFTDSGQPKVDEEVLKDLPWVEAKLLCDYLMIQKRIGQLAEGDNAWLKLVRSGRIHGGVITNGAVTGRATHNNPNMAQVPSVKKNKTGILMAMAGGWGYEFRSLFMVPEGKLLMGADLSGLELRCLAHFMAEYDGGAYGKVLLEGDIHTANQLAAGLDARDQAKTFIYAFLYGAGDEKIGTITGVKPEEEAELLADRKAVESVKQMLRRQGRPVKKSTALTILKGRKLKAQFLAKTPALKSLIEAVQKEAKSGTLVGLDGRLLHVRSTHSALNTLLQSAGALIAKQALIFFDQMVTAKGWSSRVQQVAWVHDEIQVECDADIAEEVGRIAVCAFEEAGRYFSFRVPITGEFKVGRNWAETH